MASAARAFWVTAAGRGEIRDESIPDPRGDEVVVRAVCSGISRGTETLVFQGRVPPSEHERMRAPYQSGAFPFPVKYGYASVGVVEAGPSALAGRHVFVLHPHQTRYVVPAGAVHLIPEGVPPARAVLAANLETAINGVWDAGVQPGDRVTVVGGGVVGCLVAWLAGRIPGCELELVDVNPARRDVAARLGVGFALPDDATPERDVIVHASGSPAGLATALALAAFEAAIVEMSWYGTTSVTVPLGQAFHARRLTIRASQVGHVARSQRARWDTRRRMQLALQILIDPVLDSLITGESAFEDLPRTMAELSSGPGHAIGHRIRYA